MIATLNTFERENGSIPMNREQALALANDAKILSSQGLELIQQGKYREAHNLMRQAVEAGKQSRQFLKQPKIERGFLVIPHTRVFYLHPLLSPS
jgi:hypothetical protein